MEYPIPLNTASNKEPTHLRVYKLVRDMILFGELKPGEAVTIQGLTNVLSAGMTPVREAIRRLTTEGALEFQGNRRVCVPELTIETINELSFARLAIEPRLAYWATSNVSASTVAELDIIDQAINSAVQHGSVREYLIQNHRFHMAIYTLAGKPELLSIVERLWLKVGPSMRVICGRIGTQNLPDMHQLALDGLRNNDPQTVENAMQGDIEQGLESLRSAFAEECKPKNLIKSY
jgi:DNA-binding GntR family transcriptional regulator